MKTKKNEKPNCYECVHRLTIPGDCHSRCNNHKAVVQGNMIGIRKGWFRWPLNFDPVWLISCDGFSTEEADRKPMVKLDPLVELFAMLR